MLDAFNYIIELLPDLNYEYMKDFLSSYSEIHPRIIENGLWHLHLDDFSHQSDDLPTGYYDHEENKVYQLTYDYVNFCTFKLEWPDGAWYVLPNYEGFTYHALYEMINGTRNNPDLVYLDDWTKRALSEIATHVVENRTPVLVFQGNSTVDGVMINNITSTGTGSTDGLTLNNLFRTYIYVPGKNQLDLPSDMYTTHANSTSTTETPGGTTRIFGVTDFTLKGLDERFSVTKIPSEYQWEGVRAPKVPKANTDWLEKEDYGLDKLFNEKK